MCAALAQIPSYISLSEAGERLSLDPTRLQELIHAGTLNAVKFKGETVVDENAVSVDASCSYPEAKSVVELIVIGKQRRKISLHDVYHAYVKRYNLEHFFRLASKNSSWMISRHPMWNAKKHGGN